MKAQQWKAQGPFVMQAGPMEAWQLLVCVVPSTADPKPTADAAAKSKEQAGDYARLIASAPELLEELHQTSKELDTWHNWQLATNENYPKSEGAKKVRDILIKATAAIAKALGKDGE